MTKPIPDKAPFALEPRDKSYSGTFKRSSRFSAHLDATGVSLLLDRPGDDNAEKPVHMHIHFELFADILHELASKVPSVLPEVAQYGALREGAEAFYRALAAPVDGVLQMTPDEQELILQIME